ncbi:MAG: outer membrane protein transport protein [Candidatus Omnitrophica bacterium]|nr:outer membrane protein transport protein [Candidatus Omnitrophota bacterium]MCM8803219.1 outer membrane protein transport protein [Candidatus Omnitrophota bacterium]
MKTKIFYLFLFCNSLLFSQAFKNPPESCSALSQSGAFVAQSNDASAVNFNPAGLIQIKNGEFIFGFNFPYSKTEYTYFAGKEENKYNFAVLPYFYYVPKLENDGFKFGIGFNSPYGQSNEWSQDLVRKWNYQIPYYSSMQTGNFITSFSLKLTSDFSIGFGLNYTYNRLVLKNLIFIPNPGIETIGKMDVNGYSYNGTIGVLYKKEKLSIGTVYRTGYSVDYHGTCEIFDSNYPANIKVDFPDRINFGIAFYPIKNWKIEFDTEYYGFSSVKSIYVDPGFIPSYEIPKNWKNIYNFYFGTEYIKNEKLKLRGGIAKLNSPIPEETWEPSLPDADTFIISFGTEIETKIGKIDLTILTSIPEKVKKEGNYEGIYQSRGFFFAVGYKKEF